MDIAIMNSVFAYITCEEFTWYHSPHSHPFYPPLWSYIELLCSYFTYTLLLKSRTQLHFTLSYTLSIRMYKNILALNKFKTEYDFCTKDCIKYDNTRHRQIQMVTKIDFTLKNMNLKSLHNIAFCQSYYILIKPCK